ncbi:hypothetical protein F5148DRAFT_554601 [Russula earlei]|uniref:Uncharacterized protein n=1 Tax=Russula earlei TaxID=71964 RepID=A0ACC0UGD1_9AGAM|nr:hypothetical protein F5148DRAFT_554601 [Russula earlei]
MTMTATETLNHFTSSGSQRVYGAADGGLKHSPDSVEVRSVVKATLRSGECGIRGRKKPQQGQKQVMSVCMRGRKGVDRETSANMKIGCMVCNNATRTKSLIAARHACDVPHSEAPTTNRNWQVPRCSLVIAPCGPRLLALHDQSHTEARERGPKLSTRPHQPQSGTRPILDPVCAPSDPRAIESLLCSALFFSSCPLTLF